MGSINSEEIISILKTEIENYDMVTSEQEVGSVIWVGDGIATIYGIEHAMYGEIVIFENGVRGMVQDIKRDQIGCIILGKDTGIKEGTKVTRTKKKAGVPVGNAYLGRIVNALGAPIDGKGEIPADDYRPIEQEAPGIVDRQSVKQPLCHPMSLADQVITLVAANKRLMLDVDTAKTKEFQLGMLDYIHVQHAELVTKINEEKVLDDAITEQIVEAVKEYKSR